jgi:hypothetical protein
MRHVRKGRRSCANQIEEFIATAKHDARDGSIHPLEIANRGQGGEGDDYDQ